MDSALKHTHSAFFGIDMLTLFHRKYIKISTPRQWARICTYPETIARSLMLLPSISRTERGFLAEIGIKRTTNRPSKRDSPLLSKARCRYSMTFRIAKEPTNPTNWWRLLRIRAPIPTRSQIRRILDPPEPGVQPIAYRAVPTSVWGVFGVESDGDSVSARGQGFEADRQIYR